MKEGLCAMCNKPFNSYDGRRFCSRQCYGNSLGHSAGVRGTSCPQCGYLMTSTHVCRLKRVISPWLEDSLGRWRTVTTE
jgi:hypothetical protein